MDNKLSSIHYIGLHEICKNNTNSIKKIKSIYLQLLNELTHSPDILDEIFNENLEKISNSGVIIIAVTNLNVESDDFNIIGSGTLYTEPKIIRDGKSVGHIEDIVVKNNYRGNKIAQNILNKLKDFALNSNCYKVILDCDESVCPVYKSNGFEIKGIQMAKYF